VPYFGERKGKMTIFKLLIINNIRRYSRRCSRFPKKSKKEGGELFLTFVAKWGQASKTSVLLRAVLVNPRRYFLFLSFLISPRIKPDPKTIY